MNICFKISSTCGTEHFFFRSEIHQATIGFHYHTGYLHTCIHSAVSSLPLCVFFYSFRHGAKEDKRDWPFAPFVQNTAAWDLSQRLHETYYLPPLLHRGSRVSAFCRQQLRLTMTGAKSTGQQRPEHRPVGTGGTLRQRLLRRKNRSEIGVCTKYTLFFENFLMFVSMSAPCFYCISIY